MLTYRAIQTLDPRFQQEDPVRVAQYVHSKFYPKADPDEFMRSFMGGGIDQLTHSDIALLDPRFANEDPAKVYDYVRSKFYPGLPEDQDVIQRARFTGQEPERPWGDVVGDTAKQFVSGSTQLAGNAAWLGSKVLPDALGGDALRAASEDAKQSADWWRQRYSPEYAAEVALQQQRQQDRVLEGQGLLQRGMSAATDYLSNPSLLAGTITESAPYIVAMGGAGRAFGAAADAAGLSEAAATTAARAGGALTEGALEGADSGQNAGDRVRRIDVERLSETPEYQQLARETGERDPVKLREMLARKAENVAFAFSAPLAALAGYAGGALETRVLTGRGGPAGWVPGLLKEGGEEIVQEGGNTFGANLGVQQTGDPAQSLMEGVPEAAGAGAAAGIGQGAVVKSMESVQDRLRGEVYLGRKNAAEEAIAKARKGEALSPMEIANARLMFPGMAADMFDASANAWTAQEEEKRTEQALADAEKEVSDLIAGADAATESADDFSAVNFDLDTILSNSPLAPGVRQPIDLPQQQRVDSLGQVAAQGLLNRPIDLSTVTPETAPAQLTNRDVSTMLDGVESTIRPLTKAEEAFRSSVAAGTVDPAGVFMDGIAADATPEVTRGVVLDRLNGTQARIERAAAQAPQSPIVVPGTPGQNVKPVTQAERDALAAGERRRDEVENTLLAGVRPVPTEGERTQATVDALSAQREDLKARLLSRRFRTKAEAELAAKQNTALVAAATPVKTQNGRWQLEETAPAPAAAPQAAAVPAPTTTTAPAASAVPAPAPAASAAPAQVAPAAPAAPAAAAPKKVTLKDLGLQRKRFGWYKAVSEEVTTDEGMNTAQRVVYHAFNPNGLVAQKRANDERISQLVDEKKARSGAILSRGSFSRDDDSLQALVNRKKPPSEAEIRYAEDRLREALVKQEEFIKAAEAGEYTEEAYARREAEAAARGEKPKESAASRILPDLVWKRRKATAEDARSQPDDPNRRFFEGDPIYEDASGRVRIVSRLWNHNSMERQFQVVVDGEFVESHYSLSSAKFVAQREIEKRIAEENADERPTPEEEFSPIEVGGRDYQGLSRGQLSATTVPVDVTIESTGETRTVQQNAAQALDEIDADIQRHENLLNCMRSSK